MNKAIDVFLRDARPDVESMAKEIGVVHSIKEGTKEDLKRAIMKHLSLEKCPFCGNEEPELMAYDYCVMAVCKKCEGSAGIVSDSDAAVYSDFCQFCYMVDRRFMQDGEWGPDSSNLPDEAVALLRTSLMFVAAWWAVGKWNRRAS